MWKSPFSIQDREVCLLQSTDINTAINTLESNVHYWIPYSILVQLCHSDTNNSHIIIMKSFKHSHDLQLCNFDTLGVDNNASISDKHIYQYFYSVHVQKLASQRGPTGKKVRFFSHAFHFPQNQ